MWKCTIFLFRRSLNPVIEWAVSFARFESHSGKFQALWTVVYRYPSEMSWTYQETYDRCFQGAVSYVLSPDVQFACTDVDRAVMVHVLYGSHHTWIFGIPLYAIPFRSNIREDRLGLTQGCNLPRFKACHAISGGYLCDLGQYVVRASV